jgi:hypothetical protein
VLRPNPGLRRGSRANQKTGVLLDWAGVLSLASEHRVLTLLDLNLRRTGATIPQAVTDSPLERSRTNTFLNLQGLAEVHDMTRLFRSNGIPCACLKGPALAVSAYGDVNLREFSDLDILVRKEDLHRAVSVLLAGDYSLSELSPETWAEDLAKKSGEYHLSLIARNHRRNVELHWALGYRFNLSFGFFLDLDKGVWKRLRPIPYGETVVLGLPLEEELLFLSLHGAKHWWRELLWICDIAELTQAHAELDWAHLTSLAGSLHYKRMLMLSLKLAKDLLGCPLPKNIKREIESDRSLDSLVAGVTRRLFDKFDYFQTRLDSDLFNLAIRERMRDKIRFCFQLLHPTTKDTSLVSLPTTLGGLYYLIRPVRLAAYAPQLLKRFVGSRRSAAR